MVEKLIYQSMTQLRALLEANAQAQQQQDARRLMRIIRISEKANARYWRRRDLLVHMRICAVFAIPADVWE